MVVVCVDVFRTIVFHHVNGEFVESIQSRQRLWSGHVIEICKDNLFKLLHRHYSFLLTNDALVVTCQVPSPDHVAAVHTTMREWRTIQSIVGKFHSDSCSKVVAQLYFLLAFWQRVLQEIMREKGGFRFPRGKI